MESQPRVRIIRLQPSRTMDELRYERQVLELERENQELRKQLGVPLGMEIPRSTHGNHNQCNYNCDMTPQQYQRLVDQNAQLEQEAFDLQNRILRQFEDFRLQTQSQPECEFKKRYFNLLKRSQRRI